MWFYNKLTMNNKYRRLCAGNRKVIANMNQTGRTQNNGECVKPFFDSYRVISSFKKVAIVFC